MSKKRGMGTPVPWQSRPRPTEGTALEYHPQFFSKHPHVLSYYIFDDRCTISVYIGFPLNLCSKSASLLGGVNLTSPCLAYHYEQQPPMNE